MNVEIEAEAAQFPEKEYTNGIAVAVWSHGGDQGIVDFMLNRWKCAIVSHYILSRTEKSIHVGPTLTGICSVIMLFSRISSVSLPLSDVGLEALGK